jgi:hypothetical protein
MEDSEGDGKVFLNGSLEKEWGCELKNPRIGSNGSVSS